MILPSWAFYTIICLVSISGAIYLHKLSSRDDNSLRIEDFFMSKDSSGKSTANPHKLAFILAFFICAWVTVMIAPAIPTSLYALYFSFAFMGVFTVSLLSKSALVIIRDIIQVWVTKQAPKYTAVNEDESENKEVTVKDSGGNPKQSSTKQPVGES
jgi:hypothetical protein